VNRVTLWICECCEMFCRAMFGGLVIGLCSVGVLYIIGMVLAQFGIEFLGTF